MRIIISPAKKMNTDTDSFPFRQLPSFLSDSQAILELLQGLDYAALKALWGCNDDIARLNFERVQDMVLTDRLTPALFAYEGIQYQRMAPGVFGREELDYAEEHLRILSGLYGMLRPFDGVTPYRLEMQAKLSGPGFRSLYAFWNRRIADRLQAETSCIVNLASKEYSKCISPYLKEDVRFITCVFGQLAPGGKVIEKATLVKMARGEMVRYMAEHRITAVEDIRGFDVMNFRYAGELSDESTYVFIQPS